MSASSSTTPCTPVADVVAAAAVVAVAAAEEEDVVAAVVVVVGAAAAVTKNRECETRSRRHLEDLICRTQRNTRQGRKVFAPVLFVDGESHRFA